MGKGSVLEGVTVTERIRPKLFNASLCTIVGSWPNSLTGTASEKVSSPEKPVFIGVASCHCNLLWKIVVS